MTHILEVTAADDQMDADSVTSNFLFPSVLGNPPISLSLPPSLPPSLPHISPPFSTFQLTIQIHGMNAERRVAQALR